MAPPFVLTAARNKGVVCKKFNEEGACNVPNCPYAHVPKGQVMGPPKAICNYYLSDRCKRESCKFFHGSEADFTTVRAAGKPYKVEDYAKVLDPLVVTPETGSSEDGNVRFAPVPVPVPVSSQPTPVPVAVARQPMASIAAFAAAQPLPLQPTLRHSPQQPTLRHSPPQPQLLRPVQRQSPPTQMPLVLPHLHNLQAAPVATTRTMPFAPPVASHYPVVMMPMQGSGWSMAPSSAPLAPQGSMTTAGVASQSFAPVSYAPSFSACGATTPLYVLDGSGNAVPLTQSYFSQPPPVATYHQGALQPVGMFRDALVVAR